MFLLRTVFTKAKNYISHLPGRWNIIEILMHSEHNGVIVAGIVQQRVTCLPAIGRGRALIQ